MGDNPVQAIAVVFERLWTDLIQHVRGDAVADAQKLVGDAKEQAAQLLAGATSDAEKDVTAVEGDAAQLAGDAAGSTPAPPA